jgi:hypothetical protein
MFGSKTIVSERVSTHGRIRPFEPIAEVPALDPGLREHIGQVHGGGAIQKWLKKRAEWDDKYESSLITWREVRKVDRERAEKEGFLSRDLHGERPPLASLAGWWDQEIARGVGKSVDEISRKTSGAVMMWMKMSSKVSGRSGLYRGSGSDYRVRPTRNVPEERISRRSRRRSRRRWKRKRKRSKESRAGGGHRSPRGGSRSFSPKDKRLEQSTVQIHICGDGDWAGPDAKSATVENCNDPRS